MKRTTLSITTLALLLSFGSAFADKVIVTAKKDVSNVNDYPPYLEDTSAGEFYASTGNSKVTEDPVPAWGTRFGVSGYPAIIVQPTLANPGGVYRIDVTVPTTSTGSASEPVTTKISAVGATLSTNMTIAMNGPFERWNFVCFITNDVDVTQPVITLTYSDVLIDGVTPQAGCGFSRRWYPAPLRFSAVGDPCLATPAPGEVRGPLVVGQTHVDVPGIATNATAVSVYADGLPIGVLNTGVTGGVNRVTTSALVKDARIVATQTVKNQESCIPNASSVGPKVGGGANPAISVSFILDQNSALTGPVGAPATPTSVQYHIPYTGLSGGYGTAPSGGAPIAPSGCWQTVTVYPGIDQIGAFQGTPVMPDVNPYAVLAGLGFELADAADTGPFEVYIDNLINGDVVIEDFESATNGQPQVLFSAQGAAGLLGGDAIAYPQVSEVSTNNADTGTKSLRYFWQFKDTLNTLWQRAVANGPGSANKYPIVDLSQPISVRVLVLPIGQTTNQLTLSSAPRNQTNYLGRTLTMSAGAIGTPPFFYQWVKDGNDLPGEMADTYTIASLTADHAGLYSVRVTDANCMVQSPPAKLTVSAQPPPPQRVGIQQFGDKVVLTWDGPHVLQSSTAVNVGYEDLLTAKSPFTNGISGSALFFRLRQ